MQFNLSYVICMSFVCQSYVIRMSVCTRMSSICHLYVLVCHPHVTRMYACVTRMLLVYHLYVTRTWIYHDGIQI